MKTKTTHHGNRGTRSRRWRGDFKNLPNDDGTNDWTPVSRVLHAVER